MFSVSGHQAQAIRSIAVDDLNLLQFRRELILERCESCPQRGGYVVELQLSRFVGELLLEILQQLGHALLLMGIAHNLQLIGPRTLLDQDRLQFGRDLLVRTDKLASLLGGHRIDAE